MLLVIFTLLLSTALFSSAHANAPLWSKMDKAIVDRGLTQRQLEATLDSLQSISPEDDEFNTDAGRRAYILKLLEGKLAFAAQDTPPDCTKGSMHYGRIGTEGYKIGVAWPVSGGKSFRHYVLSTKRRAPFTYWFIYHLPRSYYQ